jgi:hypothetical protein
MTRIVAELLSSAKTLNISYVTPQETLLDTPETLPTTEPSTGQVQYTVASVDLPTLSLPIPSKIWVGLVYAAGKAVTAATISWRMKKNGASVATGTISVAANTFWTLCTGFSGVAVGDVLEIALWSNVADSNWDYKAYQVQVSRIMPSNRTWILVFEPLYWTGNQPTLTLGNPSLAESLGLPYYHSRFQLGVHGSGTAGWGGKANQLWGVILYQGYGFCRVDLGDAIRTSWAGTSSTYRPYYRNNVVPTQLRWREYKGTYYV